MSLVKVLPSLMLVFSIPSFAMTGKSIEEKQLYGSWLCEHQAVEPNTNITVNVSYNIKYNADKSSQGNGIVSLALGNMPPLKYKLVDNSTWRLKEDTLTMTSKDMVFTNINNAELASLLNINKLLPASINESGKIISLSNTELKVNSTVHNQTVLCIKNNTNP